MWDEVLRIDTGWLPEYQTKVWKNDCLFLVSIRLNKKRQHIATDDSIMYGSVPQLTRIIYIHSFIICMYIYISTYLLLYVYIYTWYIYLIIIYIYIYNYIYYYIYIYVSCLGKVAWPSISQHGGSQPTPEISLLRWSSPSQQGPVWCLWIELPCPWFQSFGRRVLSGILVHICMLFGRAKII